LQIVALAFGPRDANGDLNMTFKPFVAALALAATMALPAFAQSASEGPVGTWQDQWGTTFTFTMCGDGTQLCGVLNDIQGDSRTEESIALVDTQVVQANQTGPGQWEGAINVDGNEAQATLALVDENTIEITGCRAGILCSTIAYERVS
jgi:uncharacterized protein (DUF2147 family)